LELIRLARSSLAAKAADRPRDAGVLAAGMGAYREAMEARPRPGGPAQAGGRTRGGGGRQPRPGKGAPAGAGRPQLPPVGGGLLVVARMREARAMQARGALTQAHASWERARAGDDPAQWAEARAQARRAEALLEQGPGPSELSEQAANLLHAMDEEQS